MKPTTRRLGRGLGAFLDFGPAGEGGAAYASESPAAETTSILETSVAPPAPTPRAPVPAPVRTPAPVAPPAKQVAPPPPLAVAADDCAFIDDLVAPLTFPDVELE
jgi:hypothetical protein